MATQETTTTRSVNIRLTVPGSDAAAEISVPEGSTLEQILKLLEVGNPEIGSIDIRLVYNNRAIRSEELGSTRVQEGDRVSVARKVSNG